MYEAVISVNLNESWVSIISRQLPIHITILDSIPYGDGGVQDLAEVKLNGTQPEILESTIKDLPTVEFVKVTQTDLDKAITIVGAKGCGGCKAIVESGCFLVSARTSEGGWVEWKLILNEKLQLQRLVDELKGRKIDSKLILIQPIDDRESLTPRQEKIIKTALERGYYDFPKRIGIRELARLFDISTASVSETLRRGQKKIIEEHFRDSTD
ncbi:MAG: helix-turn-helix domain-containing protein [Candidatus Thermoplasmatota archaeon]|jgi:predicted DNA binding protein|nr:helix-turn-helix domain-containing protein [Candidatus Thermoplasmatota archaeon]